MKRKEKKKKIKNGKDFLSPRSKRSGTPPFTPLARVSGEFQICFGKPFVSE